MGGCSRGILIGMMFMSLVFLMIIAFYLEDKVIYREPDDNDKSYCKLMGFYTEDASDIIDNWYKLSLNTSCSGIEYFYSGKSFREDWSKLTRKYMDVYNSGGSYDYKLKYPRDLFGNTTWIDCEDFAHFTRCLSSYYNTTCSFWWERTDGRMDNDNDAHLGVCCNVSLGAYNYIQCY